VLCDDVNPLLSSILLVVLANDRSVKQEMIIMESKRKIKTLFRSGHKISDICKVTGFSRSTISKILNSDDISSCYERSTQPHSALGGYIEQLEKLLRENKLARPKRTVRHLFYVKKWHGCSIDI
jgi:uncharacterized protein YerC